MKYASYIFAFTLLIAASAQAQEAASAQAQEVASAKTQEVDDLVRKHIEVMGGSELLAATESATMYGTATAQGMEFPVIVYRSRPNKMRSEVEIQGSIIVQTFDGEEGWMVNPLAGVSTPQPMPEQQVALMKQESDMNGPLLQYKEKGNTVELAGTKDVDGTEAIVLEITRPSGSSVQYYLHPETYLPLVATTSVEVNGQTMNVDISFGDFKETDGRMVAHAIEQKVNGMTASMMKIDSVAFNVEMDDALFAKPGAK